MILQLFALFTWPTEYPTFYQTLFDGQGKCEVFLPYEIRIETHETKDQLPRTKPLYI